MTDVRKTDAGVNLLALADPADVWDAYCAEVPAKMRSLQGALAFGFDAALRAAPARCDAPVAEMVRLDDVLSEISSLGSKLDDCGVPYFVERLRDSINAMIPETPAAPPSRLDAGSVGLADAAEFLALAHEVQEMIDTDDMPEADKHRAKITMMALQIAARADETGDVLKAWEAQLFANRKSHLPVTDEPGRAALKEIVARTYSSDRRCRLDYESVAEICDIAQAALSEQPQ